MTSSALITLKSVPYNGSSDTQITLSRKLTTHEEFMLFNIVTQCKTDVVAILTRFPLDDGNLYVHRKYRKIARDLNETEYNVYLYGNTQCIPVQHVNGLFMYACVVVLFMYNGIMYTTRVKSYQDDRIALVSVNYTGDHVLEVICTAIFTEMGIRVNSANISKFAHVSHTGRNKTINIPLRLRHNYYICMLSCDEVIDLRKKYDIDDCMTSHQVHHFPAKLEYSGDNMLKDQRVIIAPVCKSFGNHAFEPHVKHQTTEFIAAKALSAAGYCGPVPQNFAHDFKMNNEPARFTFDI